MALLHTNECTHNNCGLVFATLTDLVQHIEETHINDQVMSRVEQGAPPQFLPLSCLYRVFPKLPESKAQPIDPDTLRSEGLLKRRAGISSSSHVQQMVRTQLQEAASLHLESTSSSSERKYACPINGCKKKYKNLHGVRHHAKVAHEHSAPYPPTNRPHRCQCGKAYKTRTGLDNHMVNSHSASMTLPLPVPPSRLPSVPVTLISGATGTTKPTTIQVTPGGHEYMSQGRTTAAQQQLQQALASQAYTRFATPRSNSTTANSTTITMRPPSSVVLHTISNSQK